MSSLIYPSWLLGQTFKRKKTPKWSTGVSRALSGKTSRLSFQQYPLYDFDQEYEFLSDGHPQMPSRVNYVRWSQDATQWTLFNNGNETILPIVLGNYYLAPDGTLTADRVLLNQFGATSGITSLYAEATVPVGGWTFTTTASMWMKTNDGSTITLGFGGADTLAPIGSSNVTVGPTWQRYTWTVPGDVTHHSPRLYLNSIDVTHPKYADISVWGAQFEVGSQASTLISTYGAAVRTVDLRTFAAFFNRMAGQADTFLYTDPDFNTVQHAQFATGNGSQTAFNLTASWQPGTEIDEFGVPSGYASAPEWVQNTNGLPLIYTARYGYPELLSSASRTNLALQSNFAGSWTTSAGTITTAAATSPDGTTNAAKFTEASGSNIWALDLGQASLITANERFVCSVWLKYIGRQYVEIIIDDGVSQNNSVTACFDLVNGIASSPLVGANAFASAADIQMQPFPNGWYRCSVALQNTSSDTYVRYGIASAASATSTFYPTIPGLNADAFYCWGAQIEAGYQPTALIPVTTSHVTVAADYSLSALSTSGPVNTFQQVVFGSAPANAVPLLWSGSFYYRCKFSEDQLEFDGMMSRLWEAKSVKFESILV